jgi:hypothetical protein
LSALRRNPNLAGWLTATAVGLAFLLAARPYSEALNYTFVIATALLHGQLGVTTAPSWLNELVPYGGWYYSVFPLGAVLSVLPFSIPVALELTATYPVFPVVALLAAACTGAAYAYTRVRPDFTTLQRVILATWLTAGTWFMANLLFAGAWQIALGFAVLGQLGALYWSVVKPRPVLAGLAFAVGFGNRTEVLLTAPIFLAFLLAPHWQGRFRNRSDWRRFLRRAWRPAALFCLVPFVLGVTTLAYNAARFGSPTDFGYARIPGVLEEEWYQQGIFSLSAVAENAKQMLTIGWVEMTDWPYWRPTGWGGSIILASPFLLLLLRKPRGNRLRLIGAALAIIALTTSLWVHGNPGGWQYSYRYALILLPWFLVILTEYLPARPRWYESTLWAASILISGLATYLFLWAGIR